MSDNNIYTRIPLQLYADICPVCSSEIKQVKNIKLITHKRNGTSQEFSVRLPYCMHCDLPSSYGDLNKSLNKLGYSASFIAVKRNENVSEVKEKILNCKQNTFSPFYRFIPNRFIANNAKSALRGVKSIGLDNDSSNDDSNIKKCWEYYDEILADCSIRQIKKHNKGECPQCKGTLHKQKLYLSINEKYSLIVDGFKCDKCDVIYVQNVSHIEDLLRRNSASNGRVVNVNDHEYRCWDNFDYSSYRFDHKQWVDEIEIEKKKTEQQNRLVKRSAVMGVTIQYKNNSPEEYYIVNNSNIEDVSSNIIFYESDFGLELLTAACVEKRNMQGVFQGKEFVVKEKVFAKGADFADYLVLNDINIKSDGGYASSVKNSWQSLVHVLMYSPFTKRLEVWRATLDKDEHECYMDMFLFRKFLNKFGNPGIMFNFIYKDKSYGSNIFDELNAESVLKVLGYTVSSRENLSTRQRRELLMDIVDLEIITIHKIVSLLRFFIQTHPQDSNYEAREKWYADMTFIENYKANPQRFYIAQ